MPDVGGLREGARRAAFSLARHSGETVRVPLGLGRGLRLELDHTTTAAFYLGLYEPEVARAVRGLCRPGIVAFDVGSLNGYYSLAFGRLTGSPVVAFDSDPDACARISRNAAANPPAGEQVTVVWTYLAHEVNDAAHATTLDAFVASSGIAPGLVKIDVEGAEEAVLAGAPRLLASRRPAFVIETHSLELEERCGDLLRTAGYAVSVLKARRFALQRRAADHNRWLVAEHPGSKGEAGPESGPPVTAALRHRA
jgi:predicted RNA methylase